MIVGRLVFVIVLALFLCFLPFEFLLPSIVDCISNFQILHYFTINFIIPCLDVTYCFLYIINCHIFSLGDMKKVIERYFLVNFSNLRNLTWLVG